MLHAKLFAQCDRCGATKEIDDPGRNVMAKLPTGWSKVTNIVLCDRHKMWIEVRIKDDGEPSFRLERTRLLELASALADAQFQAMEINTATNEAKIEWFQSRDYVDHLKTIYDNIKVPPPISGKRRVKRKITLEGRDE